MTAPPTAPAGSDAPMHALQLVLAAHYAAVYAYSLIGVRVSTARRTTVATLQEAHRDARDATIALLAASGVTPEPPAAVYRATNAVTDEASALRWALQLEQACSAGYRTVLLASAHGPVHDPAASTVGPAASATAGSTSAAASSSPSINSTTTASPATAPPTTTALRQFALAGLASTTQWANGWRVVLTPATPSVAFPGV